MVGDFGWEHEGTECQVDTVKRHKKDFYLISTSFYDQRDMVNLSEKISKKYFL